MHNARGITVMSANHVTLVDSVALDAAILKGFSAVKFSAEWCPPCHMMEPVLDKIAAEYKDRMTFLEIDVDEADPRIAEALAVRALPTLVFFRDAQPIDRLVGLPTKEQLRRKVEQVLAGPVSGKK
jgi:thioredoxin